MNRRAFIEGGVTLLISPVAIDATAMAKIPRIGVLRTNAREASDPASDGLRQGLQELGYVEGESVQLEYRWAEGIPDRLSILTAQLVALDVDVVVAGGEQAVAAVRQATTSIPIVMGASNDPVGAGFVSTLGRPGGNVTGMTILSGELSRKRLELLKEVVPRVSRIAVLSNPTFPGTALDLSQTRDAPAHLG